MTHRDQFTLDLTENILDTIREPLIVVDKNLRVITASRYFYRIFLEVPEKTEGQLLYRLGQGQWNIPKLRDLLQRIVAEDTTIDSFEVEQEFPSLGNKIFLLNARRVRGREGPLDAILLAFEDITERRAYELELQRLALTDHLTGLANRNRFNSTLERTIREGRRFGFGIALLMMDLDDFKHVNDTFGHPAGDMLLQDVAAILIEDIREVDTVARLGGDEFAVILAGTNEKDDAERLARRYIGSLDRSFKLEGREVTIGISIGIAHFPSDADNAMDMLRRADLALYRAKKEGRNTYRFFDADLERK